MRCKLWVLWLLLFGVTSAFGAQAERSAAELAYRRGDYQSARTEWLSRLEAQDVEPKERARLCYNLGNAAFRAGELPEAVGWYTAALRHDPRNADTWHNLELARSEAGLAPADRGDLADTLVRLVGSLTLSESEWLVLAALALLAVLLAGEALRGGRAWRRACVVAVGLVLVSSGPWLWNLSRAGGSPMMVVQKDGAAARSEPRPDAKAVETLEAGERVERLDSLPGWIQVRTQRGERRWIQEERLFDLDR